MGYIVGSQLKELTGQWQWALRCTPVLGVTAVILILFVLQEPERGASECSGHLTTTSLKEDIKYLIKKYFFSFSFLILLSAKFFVF